jgi:hypothetical protein
MTTYLEGNQVPFRTAQDRKNLVGKAIRYLRDCDIDKSGRGMFFPRVDVVTDAKGKQIFLENGNTVPAGDLIEVVLIGDVCGKSR